MKKNKKNLLRSGISLSILTMISRILGLVREMIKAAFLGTSDLADAFTFAFQLPNLFRRLFAENSISVAFIPTFKRYIEKEKDTNPELPETREFVSATFTVVSFLTAVFTICGIAIAPLIIPFFTKSTDATIPAEMVLLTRIMFPYLFVISIAAFFQGILNGVKVFSPSGFTPILFNLCIIGFTYLLSSHMANPARAMAIGVIVGGTFQAAFQLPFVIKKGWKFHLIGLKKAFTNKGLRTVVSLIIPTLFGMAAYQLNDLVSMALAGRAGTGIQSSLQYSLRLQELILGIFAVTIGTVILPDLTSYAQKKNYEKFSSLLVNAIKIIALITIPITFFSLLTGESIIRLVYQSNNFSENSVKLTLEAFKFHILGLFFIALNRILAPSFYAQSNTKSPTIAGIIGFIVNMIMAIILAIPMKGAGIALALSIASAVNTIVLFIYMRKDKTTSTNSIVKTTLSYGLKMVVLSIIASIPVLLLKDKIFSIFTSSNRIIAQGIPLLICAIIFAFIGIFLLILTKDSLLKYGVASIKKRGQKD